MRQIKANLTDIVGVENYKAMWVNTDPYEKIGIVPKPFTSEDLFAGEIILDNKGDCFKITEIGSGGFFGLGKSWLWLRIKQLKRPTKNKYNQHICISTRNPNLDYGGVGFGGWGDSIEDCIRNHFPKKYCNPSAPEMYYNKNMTIVSIEIVNIETGEKTRVSPTKEHNKLLNSLFD